MSARQTLAKLRKLLSSHELDEVRQAVELAEALDDPEVNAVLLADLRLTADGVVEWGPESEIKRRVKAPNRAWAALELLRISGALEGAARLDISGAPSPRICRSSRR